MGIVMRLDTSSFSSLSKVRWIEDKSSNCWEGFVTMLVVEVSNWMSSGLEFH